MLNEELENKKLSIQEIIGMRLLLKAATKTDARDIELLINRMDGLLTQKTDGEMYIKADKTILDIIAENLKNKQ
jgi:DNA-binding FadR family transcriptional regulator